MMQSARFGTSWFPLKNFTRRPCHPDWMVGPTKFRSVRDELSPGRYVGAYTTVFWNRTLNAAVALDSYEEAIKTRDPAKMEILEKLQLPDDIRM